MKIIEKIIKKGDELSTLREEITKLEEESRSKLEPLKLQREAVQEELKLMLSENKLKSIKTSSGDNYTLAVAKGLSITDEKKALEWCVEHGAVSIDKLAIKSKLSKVTVLPAGFEFSEREYISVRKANKSYNKNDNE